MSKTEEAEPTFRLSYTWQLPHTRDLMGIEPAEILFSFSMAFLCSRTYLGTVLKQGIVVTRVPSLSHTLLRRDASTATKLKATPKSTGKASSPKATRKKTPPSSPVQKKPTPATSKTVSGTQAQAQAPPTQNDVVQETATDSADAKAYQEMSEEEREKEIQRLMQMSELMPTMDFFGQEIHSTLGVFRKQSR